MAARPAVIVFDVIETLFSLESLTPRLKAMGLPPETLSVFFAQLLRDAFSLEVSDTYVPFRELAQATLKAMIGSHGLSTTDDRVATVLQGFSELEPHPDVKEAFDRIQLAAVRIFTLTNGSAENTGKLLEKAGLSHAVEKTISIDAVRHWKPHREVYLHAVREAGVAAERVALVAAHAWDTHGAKQAGLRTGWVQRVEKEYSSAMSPPDVRGASLPEVVDKLLAY